MNLRKLKKKSNSRFTEITIKIEDWILKFAIFENFTNHSKSIRDINRVSREQKKIRRQRKFGLPQSQIMNKTGEREGNKFMSGSEKGSWGQMKLKYV